MIIFGWIMGVLLLLIGSLGSLVSHFFRKAYEAEADLEKVFQELKNDPEYTKSFDQTGLKYDLDDNKKIIILFRKIGYCGCGILIIMSLL